MTDFVSALEARFLRYVRIDTQSREGSSTIPSTACQFDLLRLLAQELTTIGAADVRLVDHGFVFATLPATVADPTLPRLAFLAHVDTAPGFKATGVQPIVHRAYDGTPIALPDDPHQVLDPAQLSHLQQKRGHDIVTASGTTLLGADDKAGVAIIMTMAEHLLAHPAIPHGTLRICFTSDEEIGTGINNLDLADLAADYAYTLDGGAVGELDYESFSADKAVVRVTGVSAHPGDAFGKLVNALHLAAKIIDTLPQHTNTPETTTGRQGFIHVYAVRGSTAACELHFILRDFEREGLARQGDLLRMVCAAVNATEPRAHIAVEITPQYRNMRYWLENDMRPVDMAVAAMRACGIEPVFNPVRGGTDGSKLTERGLLTPNLFTGMQEVHGPREWVSLQDMAQAVAVCIALVQAYVRSEP